MNSVDSERVVTDATVQLSPKGKKKPTAWAAGLCVGGGTGARYRFRRFAVLEVFGCGIFFHRKPVPSPSHSNFISDVSSPRLRLLISRRRVSSLDLRPCGSSIRGGHPAASKARRIVTMLWADGVGHLDDALVGRWRAASNVP